MITYPNQIAITIHKQPADDDKRYLYIDQEAVQIAAKNLTPSGLKIWLYLAQNSNGYVMALSHKELEKWGGLSKNAYKSAKDELKEKGYLQLRKGNHYDFFVFPQESKAESVPAPQIQVEVLDLDSLSAALSGDFKPSPKPKPKHQEFDPYESGDY